MEIENHKLKIAKVIKEVKVEGLDIQKYQYKPKTFTKLPAITYSLTTESIAMQFRGIGRQRATFQINIWGEKSTDISKILIELKKEMIQNGIFFVNGGDFEDPSGIKRYICSFEIR